MAKPTVTLTIRISKQLYNALKRQARSEDGGTMNRVVINALKSILPAEIAQ